MNTVHGWDEPLIFLNSGFYDLEYTLHGLSKSYFCQYLASVLNLFPWGAKGEGQKKGEKKVLLDQFFFSYDL